MFKTLLGSLIVCERISTTEAKAKELKRLIDPIINKVKKARADEVVRLSLVRELHALLPKMAADKLNSDFSDRFAARTSGYTRVVKLEARKSDAAEVAIIEFV
jgi:large subunit ribosomal protein L17